MKHLDFRPNVTSLPIAARLVKPALAWLFLAGAVGPLTAQQLFVDATAGIDTNTGTRERPLKSLTEAAKRINNDTVSKSSEVILASGLYVLSQTALFQNNKPYTATDRLVIRAEVLPRSGGVFADRASHGAGAAEETQ